VVDIEVLIEVVAQAAVCGVRTRAAIERVTIAARSASLLTAPLQIMMRPWSGR
jgi:hypothetical protein